MSPTTPAAALKTPPAAFSSLRMLVLLCIAFPLAAYVAVGTYRYRQIRAETEVRLDRSLRIAHEHALKVLDSSDTLIARVLDAAGNDSDAALKAREKPLHEQFLAMARDKPQIQSIWLLDAQANALAGNRLYPVPPINVADREYYAWHKSKGGDRPGAQQSGLFFTEVLSGRVTNDLFFQMSRGRYLPDGTFAGLVAISLLPSYFQKFHDDLLANEPGLAINMVRSDGAILSRWPPIPGAPPRLSAGSPVMQRIAAGELSGNVSGVSSVDGRERLLMYRKLGDYPVYIGSGMDMSEIQKRWLKEMGLLAAFGFPPLMALFFASRVALRRTRDALSSAERLSEETQARHRVEEALLQAQKLEALGRLTGGVAHDFNNALMVISNNLYLLKLKHPGMGGAQVESIGRAVGSATKLTRQLLAFSRRQALVPEYVSLQARLPTLTDLLGPVLGSQVQLSVTVDADTQPILVDSAEFELALINLAINARDAMPAGGSFSVSARNAGENPPALAQPLLLNGPMVVVEARDTGLGIAPDVIDKVFEPFFTTKPVGEGTGLGLSQVWGLCQRAGGTASVESRQGEGTVVRLFFPAVAERAPGPDDAPAALLRPLGKRVLLVEDNDDVAAALAPVLEAMGCAVTRLDRGVAARDWLARQQPLPDIVLTDVMMPGEMDGVGLAQHVRSTYPQLRVVLMTGYAEQLEAIGKLGFEILPKPCSAEMLAETLGRTSA